MLSGIPPFVSCSISEKIVLQVIKPSSCLSYIVTIDHMQPLGFTALNLRVSFYLIGLQPENKLNLTFHRRFTDIPTYFQYFASNFRQNPIDVATMTATHFSLIRASLENSLFLVAGLSKNRVGRSAKQKSSRKKVLNFLSRILLFICILRCLIQSLPPQVNIL